MQDEKNALSGYNQELMEALMNPPKREPWTWTKSYPTLAELLRQGLQYAPLGFASAKVAGRGTLTGLQPTHPAPEGSPVVNALLAKEAMVPASRPYSGIAKNMDDFGRMLSRLEPQNAIDRSPNANYNVPDINLLVGGKGLEPPARYAPDHAVSAYNALMRSQGDVAAARTSLPQDSKAQSILNYWESLGVRTGRPGWSAIDGGGSQ